MGNNKTICPNCNNTLPSEAKFCPTCSQKVRSGKITVKEFLQEFVDNVFNLDSKFFQTIGALFIPGKLTLKYFEGKRNQFDLNLNPAGTDFQKKVWNELLQIPYGKTCSYLDIAKRLGDPKSIRAAATANGKNPLWIVIPCHRVIGSDGSLTGYAGGLWRKKWLLDHENPVKQTSLF